MKKILVPTDFSETAKNALQYAINYAYQTRSAAIKVVHVFMPDASSEYQMVTPMYEYLKAREAQLDDFMEEAIADVKQKATNIEFTAEVLVGFAVDEIRNASQHFDLIIMGSTGENGILGKLFGSVSTGVAQKADCPVILIPRNAQFKHFDHILYACGCNDLEDEVIDDLKAFNASFNANIHFIHVKSGKKDNFKETQTDLLDELFEDGNPTFSFEFAEIEGENVFNSLNQYADKNNIGLMVMVTKHRNLWEQLFHRSETKHMAMESTYPLLVFHIDN